MFKLHVVCSTALICLTLGYQPIAMANTAIARTAVAIGVGLRASVVPLQNGVATRAQTQVARHVTKKLTKKNSRKRAQKQRRRYVLMKRTNGAGWEPVARFKTKMNACGSRGVRRTKYIGKNVQFIIKKSTATGTTVKVSC